MFNQIGEKYAADRKVILVALKTDGGGVPAAYAYLKKVGAEADNWIVGADDNAAFYKKITGTDGLFGYAVIDPQGTVAEKGKAGMFYNTPQGKTFSLAKNDISAKHGGNAQALLPADKEYHKGLAGIVRQAELGFYAEALKACAKASQKSELTDSALALHADILAALDAQVAKLAAILKDPEAEGRFMAYLGLEKIMKALPREACGKAAKAACKSVAKDKAIKRELKAQKAFLNIMKQAAKMNKAQKIKVLGPALEKFIKTYAGTYYAGEAEKEIKKLN